MASLFRNLNHFLVSFIFSLSLFFLFPLSVYTQNIEINQFSFKEILLPLILLTIIGFIFTYIFVVLITKRLKYIPLLITTLIVCLWVQGNFIKYDLGSLDGHLVNWADCFRRIWIEILVWAAIFAIFIIFRKILRRNNNSILIFLFFLFTLPSLFILINSSHNMPKKYYLDYSKEFQYSKNNIIVIILDNFRTDAFVSSLEKYPEYQDTFKDFIFFEDAVGGYTTTQPSIPLILTGDYYQNLVPMKDHLSTIESSTISYQLKNQGYAIESYPYVPFFSSIYDNRTNKMSLEDLYYSSAQQLLISGIRYSPLVLKPLFIARYYYGVNYIHKDMVTFNEKVSEVEVTTNTPLFKFIHFSGAHFPYSHDSSLQLNQVDYLEQAAGSLLPVINLLTELKNAGVYDDSLILIMGDHGNNDTDGYLNFPLSNISKPLLLAKNTNQQFENIQISDSPVALCDIPKTIADETGIDLNYPGYSIFGNIPENRIRHFYYYTWNHENWTTDYMPSMYEFEITGPARLTTSWKYIGQYVDGNYYGKNNFEQSDLYNTLMGR